MGKKVFCLFLLIMSCFLLFGCSQDSQSRKISIVGSTSVSPLVEKQGSFFEQADESLKVDVQSVGSSAGIKAAEDGTVDIGMSSRYLREGEAPDLKEITIALDGIALVVNEKNPVKNLTKEELKQIFSGHITNWSEVGGNDRPIVIISREEGSGTRTAFEELLKLQIKKGDNLISGITDNALITDGNGSVKQNVASKENAIGYVSLGVIDGNIKAINIEGVKPTEENVRNKTYELFRPFIFLTNKTPSEDAQIFIDFVLSDQGQDIVSQMQYIPVN